MQHGGHWRAVHMPQNIAGLDKNNDQFEVDVLILSPAIEAFESDCSSFGALPRHYSLNSTC